jgi:hypothetical protein
MTAESEIETIERDGWKALSGPNGANFWDRWMADDGLMVFPGVVMDKQTAIETMRRVTPWSSFSLSGVRVVVAGDTGLVTYQATAERSGQPTYAAIMSSVYVRVAGQWLLLLHQQSPG